MKTLFQLFDCYFRTHMLSKTNRVSTGVAIRSFEEHLGRTATTADLNPEAFNKWLESLFERNTERTIEGYGRRVKTLWYFAIEDGLTTVEPPGGIPSPPPPNRWKPVPAVDDVPKTGTARDMELREYVQHYRRDHEIKQSSVQSLNAVVARFSRYLGRQALLADLAAPQVNQWLASMHGKGSPETAYGYRRMLLTLWRAAHLDGFVAEYPHRVRRIKRPDRIVEGWDAGQMAKLLAACDHLRGAIRGVRIGNVEEWFGSDRGRPWRTVESEERQNGNATYLQIDKRAYFRAMFLVAWDSGLRLGDVFSIERSWIERQPDGSGRFAIVQSKVGRRIDRFLRPETMQAIDAMFPPERKLLFPLWCFREAFYRVVKRIVKRAGLSGTMRWIRRGSASEVEKASPGCGKLHLGHSPKSVGLFEQSYAVMRICGRTAPLPPAIVPIKPKGGAA